MTSIQGQDIHGDWHWLLLNADGSIATLTIPEYGWLDTEGAPTPAEPNKLAFGVEVNTTTHKIIAKYWNGTSWQEVL